MTSDYLFPTSIEEALSMLKCCGGQGRVIAGGTDLMLQVREGRHDVEAFVDITRIAELHGIREMGDGTIWIGATTTHREIWESPLIQSRATVLAEACKSIGALQIQNVGTIGGNVVNAMPAADGSIALACLDAQAQIANERGDNWVELEDVFSRPGVCKVEPTGELLLAFRFKGLGEMASSSFGRLARRRALALPVLNCGVAVHLDEEGKRFVNAAIALGPVAPIPYRARRAERLLAGATISEKVIRQASHMAMEESNPRSNILRASREYRLDMVEVLVRRGLEEAVNRARAQAR